MVVAASGVILAALSVSSLASGSAHAAELDPASPAAMLRQHFSIEHTVDLAAGLDPASQAGMLQEHFRIEHVADI